MHQYRNLDKYSFITIENVKKGILLYNCVKNKYICMCTFSVLAYPEPYIQEITLSLFLRHCSHICIWLIRSYNLCNRVTLFF